MIWKRDVTLEQLNQMTERNMLSHLGMVFTRLGERDLEATMPVDDRTRQPFGLLHGGASVALAESLGSMAGYLCSEQGECVVGVEINASHLRPVSQAKVRGVCRPLHLGRKNQVWQIEVFTPQDKLCCIARLSTAVLGA
ncbi:MULTISPECIES: hotdog fold thioesterase [Lonsdalea]|uniref:Thioesterase n=2 Tax=Lonsdalea TaxID=1082702 RepID=A0ACD1JGD5_9GAMM|nr:MULTISPECIES: hotdog fold thioesterase [Lonsdalea]OSM98965.1 thioesterase [Lonsdalea populi]OSN02175.1 thioesterase [Lonsdalea populi]QPQ23247.1 hotdog fold thioesterase [Lonsdalea populi]RAT15951.1 thioesterase [Lonsdalea quercina]RAT18754.1 thioesterase [Lonsdalea quercina]